VISPAIGENEEEIEAEGDSEDTQSDKDADEVDPIVETADVPVVTEEGRTRKRRQKTKERSHSWSRKRTKRGSRRDLVVLLAEELDQQVDELLARPFVSNSLQDGGIEIDRDDREQEIQSEEKDERRDVDRLHLGGELVKGRFCRPRG
ncbi:hypothetical protein Dimus_022293, partial [Dionaea muscipula]